MGFLPGVIIFYIFSLATAEQHRYNVYFKELKVEYFNKKYVDVDAGLYNLNKTTKAVNITIMVKTDLPDDTEVIVKAMKWFNGDYLNNPLQGEKRLKDALEMQTFDIHAMCIEYARPPIIWPIKKNVPYHVIGWVPDSSTYPPNIPEGKWKLQQTIAFANGTKLLVSNWFSEIRYMKQI